MGISLFQRDRSIGTPSTLWLDEPESRERATATAPSDEVRQHALNMIDNGFTIIKSSIPAERCNRAIAAFEEWEQSNPETADGARDEHGHYPRFVNFHVADDRIIELFTANERALAVQDFCFGDRTQLYTSLFYERGSAQAIHRDAPYFRTEPQGLYFGMWVALENVDLENGPLMMIPKGHRVAPIDAANIGRQFYPDDQAIPSIADDLWGTYQAEVSRLCAAAGLAVQNLSVEQGDTILWHPLAPHGGAPIVDLARTRFSIVFHTTPEGIPVYQGEVFFASDPHPSPKPKWSLASHQGRLYADLPGPHFG